METNGLIPIRWLIRRDMPEVLQIESLSGISPQWGDEDFLTVLRQRNCIGNVAEIELGIRGYMIYELHKGKLELVRMGVHAAYRRNGIGTAMLIRLQDKLSQQRRNAITCTVRESQLSMCQLLRSRGFRCLELLQEHFEDTGEDGLYFEYRI